MLATIKYIFEALALALILYVFFRHSAISFSSNRIPKLTWFGVLLLFFIQAMFQFTTRNQYKYPQKAEPFPFTRWAMFAGYTESARECTLYDWMGSTEDGRTQPINPARLFLTTNAVTLFTKTQSLGSTFTHGNSRELRDSHKALTHFAQGILKRHNELNPSSKIVSISLFARTFPLKQGTAIPSAFDPDSSLVIFTYSSRP